MREVLDLTVSLDHDIVDGAPAARFVQSFCSLMEGGLEKAAHGLRSPEEE